MIPQKQILVVEDNHDKNLRGGGLPLQANLRRRMSAHARQNSGTSR